MPKPINATLGECPCSTPGCTETAAIRKMKGNGKLYLHCPECLTIRPTGARFQDYILENGSFYGAPGHQPPAPLPEPEPETVPEPPKPAKPAPVPGPRREPEPEPPPDNGQEKNDIWGDWGDW